MPVDKQLAGGKHFARPREFPNSLSFAGNDPGDVLLQRETMLATLPAEKTGLVVNGGIATLAMPTPIEAAPKVTIQEKIDAHLDDLRRAKRPAGTISDQ
jgi:hypothetical protein